MGIRTGYNDKREMYMTDGNTVRVVVPEYTPDSPERPKREVRPLERQVRPTERQARPAGRQASKTIRRPVQQVSSDRALTMDFPLLAVLLMAVAATLVICYGYLRLNASISASMDNIKAMETRLETLRTENDALEQSIDISVDLNHVYNVAVNELGMVHAGSDHVILYDKTESEYVRQYENIPKTTSK